MNWYKRSQFNNILYHATYMPLLEQIKKEGLLPPIFLAQDKYQAESYAEVAIDLKGLEKNIPEKWFDNIVILSININNLDTKFLKIDPNVREVPFEGQTFVYNLKILPGIINELV